MKTSLVIKFGAFTLVGIALAMLTGCGNAYTKRPYVADPKATTISLSNSPLVSRVGDELRWHEAPEVVVEALLQFAAVQEKELAKLVTRLAEYEKKAVTTVKKKK